MTFRRLITLAAVAAASLSAAPAAQAHPVASTGSVKSHVKQAERALDDVARLAASGQADRATRMLSRSRTHARSAAREAGVLSASSPARAASAQRVVAHLQADSATQIAALVEQATGTLEAALAKGAFSSVAGRDAAIAQLAALAELLPEAKRAGIAAAIAAIVAKSEAMVASLSEALARDDVAGTVRPWIEHALGQAAAGISAVTAHLEGIVAMLPAAARPAVGAALDMVAGVVSSVTGIIQQVLAPAFGTTAPAADDNGGAPAATPQLPGLGGLLAGLGIGLR